MTGVCVCLCVAGHALIDLMHRTSEKAPQCGRRVLCRHPFQESKRAYVNPAKVESLHKVNLCLLPLFIRLLLAVLCHICVQASFWIYTFIYTYHCTHDKKVSLQGGPMSSKLNNPVALLVSWGTCEWVNVVSFSEPVTSGEYCSAHRHSELLI